MHLYGKGTNNMHLFVFFVVESVKLKALSWNRRELPLDQPKPTKEKPFVIVQSRNNKQ